MTPLKLKRKQQGLESTLDRTLKTKTISTLNDIVPSFITTNQQCPPPLSLIQPTSKPKPPQHSDTSDLEEKLYQLMLEDNEKSQFNDKNGFRNKSYIQHSSKTKMIKGDHWPIPERVKNLHQSLEQSQNQAPSFTHGCLPTTAIYYFALQNRVLFYDLARAIRLSTPLDDCFLQDSQFQFRVFELKEISWTSSLFTPLKNKNIILISSPWKISFAVVELPDIDMKANKRWLKITMLNYHFVIDSKKADYLTEGNKELFYLDQKGRVNRLWFQPHGYLDRLLKGNHYSSASQLKNNSLTPNYFYLNRKITLFDRLKHYGKVLLTEAKNLFTTHSHNYALVYDHKRQLLFSMVDTRHSQDTPQKSIEYSHAKMISCWTVQNNILNRRCSISELQLLTSPENDQILTHNISKNNKIAQLRTVQQAYYPDCCLLLVLSNGIRLYLKIQENNFQIASFEYPPSLQHRVQLKNRKCMEYNKPVELVHLLADSSTNLITIKQDNEMHTFLLWKEHQLKEDQHCCHLHWTENINHAATGADPPAQSFLFKSSLGSINSLKTNLLKSINTISRKQPLFNPQNAHCMHALARDIFYDPPLFIHTTDLYLQYFYSSRPIDLMFMSIQADIFDPVLLVSIFPEHDKKDLQCLLLQLLCDQQGLYIKDLTIIQCLNSYSKQCLQSGVYKDFDNHKLDFFKALHSYKTHKLKLKQIKPELINAQTLNSLQKENIRDLILALSKEQTTRKEQIGGEDKYIEEIRAVVHCTLTYLSRIVRYIWTQDLKDINPKIIQMRTMIEPIMKTLDFIFDREYLARAKAQIQSKRYTIYDSMVRLPSLSAKIQYTSHNKNQFQDTLNQLHNTKHLMDKIIQLLFLINQIQLPLKKKFSSCLSMQPQFLQQHIFNHLIVNYNHPFKTLEQFRTHFPLFIGKNLEKSLKIHNQTKTLNPTLTYQTAKHHQQLPDYLLAYLKQQKGIRNHEAQELRINQQQKITIAANVGSKEAVEELKKKLQQPLLSFTEKQHLLQLINKQLQLYKMTHNNRQDNFYLSNLREINSLNKIVSFQQILLKEYQKLSEQDEWVSDHLQKSQLNLQTLKTISQTVQSPTIKLIFLYYFKQQFKQIKNQNSQKLLEHLFIQQYQKKEEERKKLGFSLSQFISHSPSKMWKGLEKEIMLLIGKIKKQCDVQQLVENVAKAQESARMVCEEQEQDTQMQTITTLLEQLQKLNSNYKNIDLTKWTDNSNYPVVSLLLVKAGIDASQLTETYLNHLHQQVYSPLKISQTTLPFLINLWLNLYCLLLQYKTPFVSPFLSKSKQLLSKIQNSKPQMLQQHYLTRMQNLLQILKIRQQKPALN